MADPESIQISRPVGYRYFLTGDDDAFGLYLVGVNAGGYAQKRRSKSPPEEPTSAG
jgi:hypothetical protein